MIIVYSLIKGFWKVWVGRVKGVGAEVWVASGILVNPKP